MESRKIPSKTSEQARGESRQVLDSGWADWLVGEVRERAAQRFEAADPDDMGALRTARALYGAAAVVDSIIRDNAR